MRSLTARRHGQHSGFTVWPREVEEMLYTHPVVQGAAAVPTPGVRLNTRLGVIDCLIRTSVFYRGTPRRRR